MLPRTNLSNQIHPCFPAATRLEHCLNVSLVSQECQKLGQDYLECLTQKKGMVRAHALSKEVAASSVYVPPYDLVSDSFEGMSSLETLRVRPAE